MTKAISCSPSPWVYPEPSCNLPGLWRRRVRNYWHLHCTRVFFKTAPLRYLHTAWAELDAMVGGGPERAGRSQDISAVRDGECFSFFVGERQPQAGERDCPLAKNFGERLMVAPGRKERSTSPLLTSPNSTGVSLSSRTTCSFLWRDVMSRN